MPCACAESGPSRVPEWVSQAGRPAEAAAAVAGPARAGHDVAALVYARRRYAFPVWAPLRVCISPCARRYAFPVRAHSTCAYPHVCRYAADAAACAGDERGAHAALMRALAVVSAFGDAAAAAAASSCGGGGGVGGGGGGGGGGVPAPPADAALRAALAAPCNAALCVAPARAAVTALCLNNLGVLAAAGAGGDGGMHDRVGGGGGDGGMHNRIGGGSGGAGLRGAAALFAAAAASARGRGGGSAALWGAAAAANACTVARARDAPRPEAARPWVDLWLPAAGGGRAPPMGGDGGMHNRMGGDGGMHDRIGGGGGGGGGPLTTGDFAAARAAAAAAAAADGGIHNRIGGGGVVPATAGRFALSAPEGGVPEVLCRAHDARAVLSLRAPTR